MTRDRTGQVWDFGEANLYVVLGPSVSPITDDLIEHPVLNLVTGRTFSASEWEHAPWERHGRRRLL